MKICFNEQELLLNYERITLQASKLFKNSAVFVEKYVDNSRHIEVQVFGDGKGQVVALGVRECSIQRRNQKVIEDTPPPGASPEFMNRIAIQVVNLCKSINYRSAGTVEFVADKELKSFTF